MPILSVSGQALGFEAFWCDVRDRAAGDRPRDAERDVCDRSRVTRRGLGQQRRGGGQHQGKDGEHGARNLIRAGAVPQRHRSGLPGELPPQNPDLDTPAEREFWRVEASAGRNSRASAYELRRDLATEHWMLARVWD